MDAFNEGDLSIDHYSVLGVPSGEEGARLSIKEISKAYKQKALELHPDKRPDDPNAHDNFQRLKFSYEFLKNDAARKLFDDLLRVRREKQLRDREFNAKRRRMVSELEERERAAAAGVTEKDRQTLDEESIKKQLKEQIARQRELLSKARQQKIPAATETATATETDIPPNKANAVLKVSWERSVCDYTDTRLREIFQEFGEVQDVVIMTKKKKSFALVVMSTQEAAIACSALLSSQSFTIRSTPQACGGVA